MFTPVWEKVYKPIGPNLEGSDGGGSSLWAKKKR